MNNKPKFIRAITHIMFIIVIFSCFKTGKYSYLIDTILLIIASSLLSHKYDEWELDKISYIMVHLLMILHILGKFGAFDWTIFGLTYDVYIHIISGITLALITYNLISVGKNHKILHAITIILIVAGFECVNEIIEGLGTIILPAGQGMLGIEPSPIPIFKGLSIEYLDTLKDMITTFIGGIIGTIMMTMRKKE